MHIFTSPMATNSLVTLRGSGEAKGARSHDLARCSTNSDSTRGSAQRKFTALVNLLADTSLAHHWRACRSLRTPLRGRSSCHAKVHLIGRLLRHPSWRRPFGLHAPWCGRASPLWSRSQCGGDLPPFFLARTLVHNQP